MSVASRRRAAGLVVLVISLPLGCAVSRLADVAPTILVAPRSAPTAPADEPSAVAWPREGQASYAMDGQVHSSPGQRPVPIASLAKVMTAYVAFHRLSPRARLVVDSGDVEDTERRKRQGESVVRVAQGEVLDRDQALAAVLVPSANNVAVMLAELVSGSRADFVAQMNRTAQELGMADTTYTDPSGLADSTVSTARDQVLLFRVALASPELARIMGSRSALLPVAGRVHNTNRLLGHGGFVAGKTGSTSTAGGCLVFRVVRDGRVMDGAVLGQRGGPLIAAGLRGARELADQALAGRGLSG